MNTYIRTAVCAVLASGAVVAGDASAPYADTKIDARLNVTVKPDTQVVHFVRDNVDPDVVTKTYILKHADPYELRGYLREMVQSRKVDASDTGIQAVKYNDGTGIIMVSAEDYRFEDSENGQGIDSIIAELDKPKVVSRTGQDMYLYQPKYRSARELRAMVKAAGADVADDATENIGGSDRLCVDENLNLMFCKTTQFSRKNIDNVLNKYDIPYPEIRAKITVYEIYAENDAKLGLDFQAWKNNDGIDLFNTGARFMRNHNASGLVQGGGWSDTKYFNFNPKWNTKYVDFLTSKGKAKILHSCEMTVRNNTTAEMERTSSVFLPIAEKAENQEYTESYIHIEDAVPGTEFNLSALTTKGEKIEITAQSAVTLTILKLAKNTPEKYFLTLKDGSFTVNGKNYGRKIEAKYAEVIQDGETLEFTSNNIAAEKGNIIKTESSGEFGFKLSMTPSISEKAAMLNITVSNSSLIGYKSNGEARIQKGAVLENTFMISNSGTKLVIGGIEKRDVVSVSGGLPILKDLPLLGWIFSTESESTKKSQLLVVAEAVPVRPAENEIQNIEKKLENAGESNTFGYRQFLIDPERR